jgi:8-oxo-dGTP diphosphatase
VSARPEVCVGAVIVYEEELLLIRRGNPPGAGRWSLPGGRVEHGEVLAEAVVREVREETGLEGACGELIGWVERIEGDDHFVILDFEVIVFDPAGGQAGDDAADLAWVPLNDVAEQPDLVDGLAEFLHDHGVIRTIT